ncbi:MAG: alpha-amylase family glycosyl hydrolase [Actinomycetota bacterium]
MKSGPPWWQSGVFYQVYPRSFADSDGDGTGDLQGVIGRLDHLTWLGVDGIWINPVMPSPNADWGYDVADYRAVHPDLGTLEDVDRLVREADDRVMRVVFDIVPNHTSDGHRWFEDALTGRDARYRDYYVWADPTDDGGPPNNWLNVFGTGSAWTLHEPTGQYYLHNFLNHQPDLNWWNEEVRAEFDDILRFWFDRGIAGFRIDVAHALVKDRSLRDNDPPTADDHPHQRALGQRQNNSMNRPEVHEVFRRWRKLADEYDPPRILIGETFVYDLEQWASFYGSGTDELNLAFNFPFALGEFEVNHLKEVVRASEAAIPPEAWPVWMASNHDVGRAMSRWCSEEERKGRVLMLLLMTLRGTPFVYYGEEIGMPHTPLAYEQLKDPVGLARWPEDKGRDFCRTPMHWTSDPGAGFTTESAEPWLPLGDHHGRNVADQRADESSMLHFTRNLIALRRSTADLQTGPYEELDSPPGTWLFRRGDSVTVALNLSDAPQTIANVVGEVVIATQSSRRERAESDLRLDSWAGAVLRK